MAFDFSKFKKGGNRVVCEGIEISEDKKDFVPLSDYIGKEIHVDGFFFTKSEEYGEQVVVVTEKGKKKVNMPKRCVEEFKEMAEDPDARKEILAGRLYLTNIEKLPGKKGKKDTTIYDYTNK